LVSILLIFVLGMPQIDKILDKSAKRLNRNGNFASGFILRLQKFVLSWRSYLKCPSVIGISVVIGVCYQLLLASSLYFRGISIGLNVSFIDWCWFFSILSIVLLLPISFAGFGIREASFVGVLALIGVNSSDAMGCSMLMLGIQLLNTMIGAIILTVGLLKRKIRFQGTKE